MNKLFSGFVLCCLILASACQNQADSSSASAAPAATANGESEAPATITVVSLVDKLNIREQPNTSSPVVVQVPEGATLSLTGEKTSNTEKLTLRGKEYNEPWIQVKTKEGKTGWVYGAAVGSPDDSEALQYERLDQINLSSLKKTVKPRGEEEGDCSSIVTIYTLGNRKLVVDETDCYDYGKHQRYFLLSPAGALQLIQTKSEERDYTNGERTSTLTDKLIDFRGAKPVMKSRSQTVPVASAAAAMKDNKAPYVQVGAPGEEGSLVYWEERYKEMMRE